MVQNCFRGFAAANHLLEVGQRLFVLLALGESPCVGVQQVHIPRAQTHGLLGERQCFLGIVPALPVEISEVVEDHNCMGTLT